jgi:peptidoglycan/xylan/chitin deacetylase (PgdA/CDA1 family)
MSHFRQGLKRLLTACLPPERWLVRGRCVRGIDGPAISLTFDDGPHPEFTPRVLDRLQMFGWKGTFFVIGERARKNPDLVRRIIAEGHELGNHTFTHGEPAQTSAASFREEIEATRRLLEQIAGKPVWLTRPPKGELTWPKLRGLWQDRQTVALWNVDPKDYRPDCATEVRTWAAAYAPRHGDIVLLHDAHPQVLSILDGWQEHGRLIGVETVTLSSWLKTEPCRDVPVSPSSRRVSESEGMPCP